jgi:hypothetical protein
MLSRDANACSFRSENGERSVGLGYLRSIPFTRGSTIIVFTSSTFTVSLNHYSKRHSSINHARNTMTWTTAKTAGLVIGILLLVTTIAGSAIFYYRRYSNKPSLKVADSEAGVDSPAPSSPNPALTIPEPAVTESSTGTVRRQTGRPQTFHDWVQSSNATAPAKSSFGHGPGPMFNSDAPSMYSRSARSNIGPTAVTTRPGTRDSIGASSLRKAVLGAAEADEPTDVLEENKDAVAEGHDSEKLVQQTKPRGYSGAWP